MLIDIQPIGLETRLRRQIRNNQRLPQNPGLLRGRIEVHTRQHPAATLRSVANGYNCFGLVFANRRTGIDEDDEIRKVLADDGYRRIGKTDLRQGDLVFYGSSTERWDHVGIVLEFGRADPELILVMSQWGQVGEWIHPIGDVPEFCGVPTQYWTERMELDAS